MLNGERGRGPSRPYLPLFILHSSFSIRHFLLLLRPVVDVVPAALVQPPASVKAWQGPYIKRGVPNDPWGNPYNYRFPGQMNVNGYDLYTFGADGNEGGGDDVDNWTQS